MEIPPSTREKISLVKVAAGKPLAFAELHYDDDLFGEE